MKDIVDVWTAATNGPTATLASVPSLLNASLLERIARHKRDGLHDDDTILAFDDPSWNEPEPLDYNSTGKQHSSIEFIVINTHH